MGWGRNELRLGTRSRHSVSPSARWLIRLQNTHKEQSTITAVASKVRLGFAAPAVRVRGKLNSDGYVHQVAPTA